MPHSLHQVDRFHAPMFLKTSHRRPFVFLSNSVVYVMLVMALPGVFLDHKPRFQIEARAHLFANPSSHHLPVHHGCGKDVDFIVIPRLRMPKLGSLPVDSPDQGTDHGPGGMFDTSETKVAHFGLTCSVDENVGGLALEFSYSSSRVKGKLASR